MQVNFSKTVYTVLFWIACAVNFSVRFSLFEFCAKFSLTFICMVNSDETFVFWISYMTDQGGNLRLRYMNLESSTKLYS